MLEMTKTEFLNLPLRDENLDESKLVEGSMVRALKPDGLKKFSKNTLGLVVTYTKINKDLIESTIDIVKVKENE